MTCPCARACAHACTLSHTHAHVHIHTHTHTDGVQCSDDSFVILDSCTVDMTGRVGGVGVWERERVCRCVERERVCRCVGEGESV